MHRRKASTITAAFIFMFICLFSTVGSAGAASLAWNTFLGQSSSDDGWGIAVDGSGYVYVSGYSADAWGVPVRASGGTYEAFVAKIADNGTLVWHTFLGGISTDKGSGLALDDNGHVYVTGQSYADWEAPVNNHTPGTYDVFVAKLTSDDGVLVWNTFMGGDDGDYMSGIAVDGSGNVYVSGTSDAGWGTSPVRAYSAGEDAFVAKLDSSGNRLWHTFLGASGADWVTNLAADASGSVYVAGTSDAGWGTPVRAYSAGEDAYVAKLNSSGVIAWNTFLGGSSGEEAVGLAIDASGAIYITGGGGGAWNETPVRAYSGDTDAFVAKVGASGALSWHTFLGSSEFEKGEAVAVDAGGNVFVSGKSYATWGAPALPYTGDSDIFVAKLVGNTGALTWNAFLGGSGYELAQGIALHSNGNVYLSGVSNASWGYPVRAFSGSSDVFAAKIVLPPTIQASAIVFTSGQQTQAAISWTRGSGEKCAVFMKQADSGTASPADNTTYAADASFGAGGQIGSTGWHSIYNGTGTGVTVTGLTAETTYRVMVCEYKGAAGEELYNIDTATGNPANQATLADNGTDNDTCALKVIPKKLHKLLSLLEPIKGFVLIGDNDTVFVKEDKPVWDSAAIKPFLKLKLGAKTIISIVFVNPFALEPGEVEVTVGDCTGKIEIKAF